MVNDQKLVRAAYPDADTVWLNRNKVLVVESVGEHGKLSRGKSLSGLHDREGDAWREAAEKLRSA